MRFNAKSGFIVTSQTSLEGRYVCIGSLSDGSKNRSEIIRAGSRMQLVEYEVRAEEEGKKRKSKGSQKKGKKKFGWKSCLKLDAFTGYFTGIL